MGIWGLKSLAQISRDFTRITKCHYFFVNLTGFDLLCDKGNSHGVMWSYFSTEEVGFLYQTCLLTCRSHTLLIAHISIGNFQGVYYLGKIPIILQSSLTFCIFCHHPQSRCQVLTHSSHLLVVFLMCIYLMYDSYWHSYVLVLMKS